MDPDLWFGSLPGKDILTACREHGQCDEFEGGTGYSPGAGFADRCVTTKTSHAAAAMATMTMSHPSTLARPAAVTVGHGNCRSTSNRSIIQCHAVWPTITDKMMVPKRSATT